MATRNARSGSGLAAGAGEARGRGRTCMVSLAEWVSSTAGSSLTRGRCLRWAAAAMMLTLIRLRYIMPLEGKPRLATCGVCGAQFLDDAGAMGTGASATAAMTSSRAASRRARGWPWKTAVARRRTAPTRRR